MISLPSVLVDTKLGLNCSYFKLKLASQKEQYGCYIVYTDMHTQTLMQTHVCRGRSKRQCR